MLVVFAFVLVNCQPALAEEPPEFLLEWGSYGNADDPFESNFFKYFAANFNELGIKKLITTSYIKSPIVGGQLPLFEIEGLKPKGKEPYKIIINEVKDINNDGAISLEDVEQLLKHNRNIATPLKGDGDFRSKECINLLTEADIVITNPPFSLFREYVSQLIEYRKHFLIIGNKNAISYKEIFKLVKENKVWIGYTSPAEFFTPDGKLTKKVQGLTRWFTNLDISKRHEELILYKKYTPEEYLKYDNIEAINVDKVAEIPFDYKGIMGVPITFLDKYNPDQFCIIDGLNRYTILDTQGLNDNAVKNHLHLTEIDGKSKYFRILIKNNNLK